MDKKEIKRQMLEMLEAGRSKTEVFKSLSGGAVKDRVLAYWIGSRPDPALRQRHALKLNILVGLTCLQAVLGFVAGYFLGLDIGPTAGLVIALIGGGIPALFAWGFYKNIAQTYAVYFVLSVSQLPRVFKGFDEDPTSVIIAVVITLGMVGYASWVKYLLFPDLNVMGAKKVKGQFIFSN